MKKAIAASKSEKTMQRVKKMNLVPYAGNGKTTTGRLHCSVGFSTTADFERRKRKSA